MSHIVGIGTDLVHVPRIAKLLEHYSKQFPVKILTPTELRQFRETLPLKPAQFLAKRFAVKEAVVKALGTGFREGISLRQIGLAHNDLGKPLVVLEPELRQRLQLWKITELQVSTSDERDYVLAFVVAMGSESGSC